MIMILWACMLQCMHALNCVANCKIRQGRSIIFCKYCETSLLLWLPDFPSPLHSGFCGANLVFECKWWSMWRESLFVHNNGSKILTIIRFIWGGKDYWLVYHRNSVLILIKRLVDCISAQLSIMCLLFYFPCLKMTLERRVGLRSLTTTLSNQP